MSGNAIEFRPWSTPLPAAMAPAVAVVRRLVDAGHEAYIVGGAVRDLLLGHEPGDADVVTSALPDQITTLFPTTKEVGIAFGVVIVISEGIAVETATFRSEADYRDARRPAQVTLGAALAADARRRDFTVNALYLDPLAGRLLDPVGGLADCQARVLRAVGDPEARFTEDALRLLRAPRLAAQCDLELAEETLRALHHRHERLGRISAERIGKEMARLLTGHSPDRALSIMRQTCLLEVILPEVSALSGVDQDPEHHPEGDVWTHVLLMFRSSPARSLPLGLAILLHDVAKPLTLVHEDRIRFPGHAARGAKMTSRIGCRLRLPAAQVERAAELVAQHMRFLDVPRMKTATLKRFLRQKLFPELLELYRLDCLARGAGLEIHEACRSARERFAAEDSLTPPPLLQGRDLLALGYPEGPAIGKALHELETAQLAGEIRTRDQALAWLQQHHPPAQN
jgi:tRNA nucleotidyltransferase/poly(A) polymerase